MTAEQQLTNDNYGCCSW